MVTRQQAEDVLNRKLLPAWTQDSKGVVEGIMARAGLMQDRVAQPRAFRWTGDDGALRLTLGQDTLTVHNNALGQAAERANVPTAFASTLAAEDPELLATVLNRRFSDRREGKHLVRSVGGQARAVLSNSYKRLDSRPIVESIGSEARALGLRAMGGTSTDLRHVLRLAVPKVFEPLPGEFVMFGIQWSNSDYGVGANQFSAFILRVWCANGAVTDTALRQVHLGKRIEEDDIYSEQTLALDTKTAASAARDVIRAYLDPAKIDQRILALKASAEKAVTPANVDAFLKAHLSKEAQQKARDTFASADVEMIPPGQNVWRLSNTLSWLANDTALDAEQRLEFQNLAGKALTLA